MATIREARVEVTILAIRDWARGAIPWAEAMRRADLSAAEEAALGHVYRGVPPAEIRRRLAAAR